MERVLLVSEDIHRLRFLADRVWGAECIAYCAGSAREAVDLVAAGLRPTCILVDPVLGDDFVIDLRKRLGAIVPRVEVDVRPMPLQP